MENFTSKFNLAKSRFATKAIFLVCGFGVSSWAPMIPYAKDRLQLNDANIGLLLLSLGAGAITTMPLSGMLSTKIGTRKVILLSTLLTAICIPLLFLTSAVYPMAAVLFAFGAGIGSIDVAMNSHGVQVQNLSEKPIMSSLHGLFSVGGLCGPLCIGLLLKLKVPPIFILLSISILLITIVLIQYKYLMNLAFEQELNAEQKLQNEAEENVPKSSWFNISVIYLGAMCFAMFLTEGALLDWSAIFLRDSKGLDQAFAGFGYAAFSVAMAFMRLVGDKVVSRVKSRWVVIVGSFTAVLGFLCIILAPWLALTLVGFVLVGIGAANIVPIFFSEGGRIKNVSSAVAIPAITTIGYAGQLAGPALLGFIAQHTSLSVALGFTAFLVFLVGLSYVFKTESSK